MSDSSPQILTLGAIEAALPHVDVLAAMEWAFCEYSAGHAVVPPVGELAFDEPPGEVHIKYGYVKGGAYYVVKIASGFYDNPKRGLPSSGGMMLLFRQATGEPVAVLLDEGRLTDVRTAAAGAVCAKHLAPSKVKAIGIVGTGIQARLQLEMLGKVTDCRTVYVWGRSKENAAAYAGEMTAKGFTVHVVESVGAVCDACNVIVTTTPSREPLILADRVRPGTHITAVGSDTPDKRELEGALLVKADVVVGDSLEQCRVRGEIARALAEGALDEGKAVELGAVIAGDATGRTSDEQITIADLTGVAVQDMAIAQAVFESIDLLE